MTTTMARPESPAPPKPGPAKGALLASFAFPDYRLIWISTIFSFMAMSMQQVARGYLAYELTGSGAGLGIVSAAWGLPQFFISPIGGVIADRVSKRVILIVAPFLMGVTTLINALLITFNMVEMWHLVVLGLLQGAVFAFNMPARQAFLPAIVGRERLANAIALQNAAANFVSIGGPALAGWLIAVPAFGIGGAFYVLTAAYALSVVAVVFIQSKGITERRASGSMVHEILNGMRYIVQRPALRILILTTVCVILLGMPYQIMLPLFAARVFHVGSEGLGLMYGMAGAGALVGAVAVAYFSNTTHKSLLMVISGVLFGLTLAAFAYAPSFELGLFAIVLVGAAGNVYMALNNTLLMIDTDLSMQGRVMSVVMMMFSLMPLAAFPMSALADNVGAPITIAGAGLLTTLVVALAASRMLVKRT